MTGIIFFLGRLLSRLEFRAAICFLGVGGISNRGVSISHFGGQGFWKLARGWMLEEETVEA
jgi:hypothetical protein